MQSSNPVFTRNDGFNGRSTPTSASSYPGYSDPSTWQTGTAGGYGTPDGYGTPPTTVDQGRMTIDSVVQKTAITLSLVVIAAALTWMYIGNMVDGASYDESAVAKANLLAIGGALIGFGLSMVNSFKRVVSPPLVIAYAIVEGVFVGAFSKTISTWVGDSGIVFGAVLGTVAAFAGTLTAYKMLDIKVTDKFRKYVTAAMFAFVGVALLDGLLSLFGTGVGFNGFGPMGLISSIIGVGLGVLMLILDFDYVEKGVAAGLPERESWRAAFGLTVTLVWIYIELLRILAILRGD